MDDHIFKLIAEGKITGLKRTSTFAAFGSFAHGEAAYDVYVDSNLHNAADEPSIRTEVAGHLNTDPHYVRIVSEAMGEEDYPVKSGSSA